MDVYGKTLNLSVHPSKDAEEAYREDVNHNYFMCGKSMMLSNRDAGHSTDVAEFYDNTIEWGKEICKILNYAHFMAGRSSQPIEMVEPTDANKFLDEKYSNCGTDSIEIPITRVEELLTEFASSHTGKMREALQDALSILKQTKVFRDANGLTMGGIFLDSAIINAESALSTNPTDNTK